MIARIWRGWTESEKAESYERLLREVVYPELQNIKGFHSGFILRRDCKTETEFLTVKLFESIDELKTFPGPNYENIFRLFLLPVFEPEASKLLSKLEPVAHHYDVKYELYKK